ncbi:hypothetical protein V565_208170, partial [Rhizoctonia solani 123E]
MLENLLDVVNAPEELNRLADPRIIAGCVSLMAIMNLSYEYGYISFRILVLALNCCLLKHVGDLDHVIWQMSTVPKSLRLNIFWGESASMIFSEVEGGERLSDVFGSGSFNEYKLDQLLNLLHADQKNLFVVLKSTKSLGLSGLMFVLWKHIEAEGAKRSNPIHFFDERVNQLGRILWRYILAVPDIKLESEAAVLIHNEIFLIAQLSDQKFIDLEDSRYVLQALIDRLAATPPVTTDESAALIKFFEPLTVPGCEDLVPDMIGLSIERMWNSLIDEPADVVRFALASHLLHFRRIFKRLKPKYGHTHPWVTRLMDKIIQADLVDLIIRSMLTATEFNPHAE